MLQLIAEATECHIRDALKAIEGVSMLGAINDENVRSYLHLDLNNSYLDVLDNLGSNLGAATTAVQHILERTSPVTCYEKLVDVCMMAYQMFLGTAKPASFWDVERLKALGQRHGDNLLGFAARLSSRPGKPSAAMLLCDLGHLHHVGGVVVGEQPLLASSAPQMFVPQTQVVQPQNSQTLAPKANPVTVSSISETFPAKPSESLGNLSQGNPTPNYDGVRVSPVAVKSSGRGGHVIDNKSLAIKPMSLDLAPTEFCHLLALRVAELEGERQQLPRERDSSPVSSSGFQPESIERA